MRFRQTAAIMGMAATATLGAVTLAHASSHREAPGITETPKVDGTDFYMFRSYERNRSGFVTFIANYQPIQAPYGGPNYFTMDPDAYYEIHIDNDGDAVEDITFQFKFDNILANGGQGIELDVGNKKVAIPLRQAGQITRGDNGALNEFERYTVSRIDGDRRSSTGRPLTSPQAQNRTVFTKPIDNIGNKTLPDYDRYADRYIYTVNIPGCNSARNGRVFVGQRAEAFAVNLGEIFDLVNLVPIEGAIEQSRENDDLVGRANVTSIALEVPINCLVDKVDGNTVIGAWTTSSLPQAQLEDPSPTYEQTSVFGGALVQQSRLSAPLVNEVVIGLRDKDLFNASEPMDDAQFADYVTNPTLPELIQILFGKAIRDIDPDDDIDAVGDVAPNNLPRADLVAAFLTGLPGFNQLKTVTPSEMMRLNTAIQATSREGQKPLGVLAEDLAGFPNGRRPGDDVVDIALRVVMGVLCQRVPLGAELGVEGAEEDEASDLILLGFCKPDDAKAGAFPYTDGAPISAAELRPGFPYLNTPIPGSPN
ncbi:DUF4331 domain-containing protein [Jannaschia sp. W003]|uniref:DUF4331 domain-containing protein n=1 Tax=Jannaschia sp. W003 TaxID=2867012 RepID=UPI0021A89BA4|nr:DUF4331 domain-containing protein [Jannaschia sp. W003]UWQ23163.1 DUF4331 domain-containing protein [Jannaschia sp. W003]